MSHLHLIPADSLAATYHFQTQQLLVEARGNVDAGTYDIHFSRVPWSGGLKLELLGWGDEASSEKESYHIKDKFDITLPSRVYPSDSVTIVDANHPNGVIVPIQYLSSQGSSEPTKIADLEPANPDTSNIRIQAGDTERINVLWREPFQIKAPADVPKQGSVSIKFDKSFIKIQDATIQDTNLVWVLNSLRTGNTQIIVTTYGGIAEFVSVKTYNVRIFVLDNVTSGESKIDVAPFSKENIDAATVRVREDYPDATLFQFVGISSTFVEISNDINDLKATFKDGSSYYSTTQLDGGAWTKPVPAPSPGLGVRIINISSIQHWPPQTDDLVKDAGWELKFNKLTLYDPLVSPKLPNNAIWEYSLEVGPGVQVNAKTGRVSPPHPK